MLVAKLDETIDGVSLATNRFPGAIHPRGFEHLATFARNAFSVWEYEVGGVRLRKTVVAPRGENTTIVLYEVLAAPVPFELRLAPFLAGRDYHSLQRRGGSVDHVTVDVPGSRFESAPDWWLNFVYDREEERGLDAVARGLDADVRVYLQVFGEELADGVVILDHENAVVGHHLA